MSSYSDFVKDIVKSGVRKIRYLKGRTESAFLSDEKAWYCPCCESKVRKFKAGSFLKHPEIYDRRRFEDTDQEVLCPVCLSFPIDESLETVYEDPSVTTPDERRRAYGESENRRLFGRDSAELLEKAGFEVSRIDGGDCPTKIKPAVGPAGYDAWYLFLCKK